MGNEKYNFHDFDIALVCEYFTRMDFFVISLIGSEYHPIAVNNNGQIIWQGEAVIPGESPAIGYNNMIIPSFRDKYIYSFQ